jgi:hypothetical protein
MAKDPLEKTYHVDVLTEKAFDWWQDQYDDFTMQIILREYMKAHDITEDEVSW